jgi:hypothetical protein
MQGNIIVDRRKECPFRKTLLCDGVQQDLVV